MGTSEGRKPHIRGVPGLPPVSTSRIVPLRHASNDPIRLVPSHDI